MATWTATDTVTGLSDKVTVPDPVVVASAGATSDASTGKDE